MKRFISQALITFLILSCSTTKNVEKGSVQTNEVVDVDFADKLSAEQLAFIKESYNWGEEKTLILNYAQPISICHFNNNTISNSGKKWWRKFYSKVNIENCLNIHVLANGEKVSRKLDNEHYFDDKNDFLFDNFFGRKKSCFGVMVVNSEGHYIQYNGHYSERQVNKFIQLLNI